MKPRRGEKPPVSKSSRSQSWRAVRSQESHSREWDFSSALCSGEAISCTNSPPCAGIRWLVEVIRMRNLHKVDKIFLDVRTRAQTGKQTNGNYLTYSNLAAERGFL